MGAFADYKPSSDGGGGGGGGGGKEAASAEPSQDQKPAEPADSGGGGGGGGGGDWPPHSVMGLPSLSPTMSQGMLATLCQARWDHTLHCLVPFLTATPKVVVHYVCPAHKELRVICSTQVCCCCHYDLRRPYRH